ncbi:hypothetical protein DVR12_24955 [Chitinophaga silvatica]|uniref:Zinc finger CGNR domain-containing protein n=1 Tax=Chitinophaga silvatica TaxID=2282649 RepID=A0A3E1Y318_9BACT|nr:CGNR zinc finger domain-containing protein [Chitinophaga silvatica]RFS19061.1 hypothetical protein DVR12_24955 [Chitinophaga silvatica]
MLPSKPIESLRLDGGLFCLDFVNTVYNRKRPNGYDYLDNFKSLIAWYGHTKLLPQKMLHTLERLGKDYPQKAVVVLEKSLQLRELLHQLFQTVLHAKMPAAIIGSQFNSFLSEAYSNLELSILPDGGKLQFNTPALEQLYWWPTKSAVELLTSDQLKQLKECPACGWLFIDKSKNQSRKWCSMATCGDVNKVTSNYQRTKRKKK